MGWVSAGVFAVTGAPGRRPREEAVLSWRLALGHRVRLPRSEGGRTCSSLLPLWTLHCVRVAFAKINFNVKCQNCPASR